MNFMQQSLVELYLLDLTVTYQHDSVFLQQLAIHLHTTIHTKKINNSTLIEHRADSHLCKKGNNDDAMKLYESIVDHIISSKGEQSVINHFYMLGGCNSELKQKFQKSLIRIAETLIKDNSISGLRGGAVMLDVIKSIHRINVIWNITEENSFIDAGIIYRPDVGFCLVIKQGFNIMIGKRDDEKIPIHCGTLVYVLESNEKTFQDSIFYIKQQISEHCQDEQYITMWNKCIARFKEMAMEFGAEEIADDNDSFISSVERDISERLTDQVPNEVVQYQM
ncbi:unnamed protein product [Rotaria sordida]|uniref:Uncharacterized protein n=1 Tax=Rotaria sordida TaxID=392033 RepID=A0A815A5C8_9BILA|nr:unnamed protein product [Rotaria sordida]CAF3644290.1 unnamed protein product [Rotaria sordida]